MMKLNKTHIGKLFYFVDTFSGRQLFISKQDFRYSNSIYTRCDVSGLCYMLNNKIEYSNTLHKHIEIMTYLHSSSIIYTICWNDLFQILRLQFIVD